MDSDLFLKDLTDHCHAPNVAIKDICTITKTFTTRPLTYSQTILIPTNKVKT